MNTVLEVLRAADARLADESKEFEFCLWRSCTCGHIYAAANDGQQATETGEVTLPRSYGVADDTAALYDAALRAVAEANPSRTAGLPHQLVSDATFDLVEMLGVAFTDGAERRAARALVLNAIWMLEERYEAQRLDVLAQTRAIVDAAEASVPVGLPV